MGADSTASWRMFRAVHRAWSAATRTSSGIAESATSRPSRRTRHGCWMRFGRPSHRVAQCCMQLARSSTRRTELSCTRFARATTMPGGCRCMAGRKFNCCRMPSMTASTTRPCASGARRRLLVALLCLPLLLCAAPSLSDDAAVRSAAIISTEDGYVVNADFRVPLAPRLIDTIMRGVSLYFNVELVIEQPRRWWFDRTVATRSLQFRLSYHPITRSYRLSIGALHRSYDTLEAAMRTMTRVRNWRVLSHDELDEGDEYRASLRFIHDVGMLPKPLVISATADRE